MVALDTGDLLVYGGRTSTGGARTYIADTWLYQPTTGAWSEVSDGIPTIRGQYAMTAVPGGAALLVGGYAWDAFTYPDIWLYQDRAWTRLETDNPPTPRAGSVAVYDSESKVVVLFGGAERPRVAELPTNETWVLDLDTFAWTEVSPELSPRPKSEGHPTLFELAMVYDSESDRSLLMIGGDELWAYDTNTNTWESRAVPPLEADFMVAAAYDKTNDVLVTHGGGPTSLSDETWLYDYNTDTWTMAGPTSPGPVGDHAMAWHAGTQWTFLFGGAVDLLPLDGVGDVKDELWSFDGAAWNLVGPNE